MSNEKNGQRAKIDPELRRELEQVQALQRERGEKVTPINTLARWYHKHAWRERSEAHWREQVKIATDEMFACFLAVGHGEARLERAFVEWLRRAKRDRSEEWIENVFAMMEEMNNAEEQREEGNKKRRNATL